MVKTLLITGSNGFVGKNLIEFYQNKYDIISLTREDHIDEVLSKKPDIIINCAASIYDLDTMFSTNVMLVNSLIEYVIKTKYKLIQIGSSAEYGKKDHATKENDNLEPVSYYAGTKAAATMMCRSASLEFNAPIIIARPYSLYGNHEKSYRLFNKLFDAFTQNQYMVLSAGYHDFIYIKDFIRGIDHLINSENIIYGDIVNFGSGVQTSNMEVLQKFIDIFGFSPTCIETKNTMAKSFESETWVCDTSYAKQQYNFSTTYSLENGILDFINTKRTLS
jgi:nucleoside-diphosphate-sugar epimerase